MNLLVIPLLLALTAAQEPADKPAPKASSIAEKTKGMTKLDGFFSLYWDEAGGKLYLEIARFDTEFLYQVALATGVGSNPVGLDRGQLGDSRVVVFQRVGPKVLLVEPNYKYRAITDREPERRAVEESFARSVLWGFKVEAEAKGTVLVDATPFFLRDAHGVVDRLRQAKQGAYRLDDSRSVIHLPHTKGFPKNTEVEALLTFGTDGDPGPLVSETAPSARSISVREHHSLIELPKLGQGFKPRKANPRVGVFAVEFHDFATPVTEPVEQRWICRHRLIKKDPNAEVSDAVEPIVYYVDPGAPEPVRSALVEGASWWKKAFEAAGFTHAYRVEVLPADADPMDLRYNVIQWVHRSTRGWSYGSTVTDPRTGEILKGRVTLDSLRARQDSLIGLGLVTACAAAMGPSAEHLADLDPSIEPASMVMARIRQLSAHEVGHTLGFAHNFAASTYGRASVMDYPAPLVKIKDGKLDLSDAYGKSLGDYDLWAVKYAYAQFPPHADESKELSSVVLKGISSGLLFLSDADARPLGGANPKASLWDNGDDPVKSLLHEMEVRRIGLQGFGLGKLVEGEPLSDLEAKLLPLYLHHRYQLQAAVKVIGGLEYTYAVKEGSGTSPAKVMQIISPDRQREAIKAIMSTLTPENLMIPSRILDLIPPRAYGEGRGTAELFAKKTSPAFDPIAAATVAADLAVSGLLQPQRAARMTDFHARDPKNPDFEEVVTDLFQAHFGVLPSEDGREAAMSRVVQSLIVSHLIALATDDTAAPDVRTAATEGLRSIAMKRVAHTAHDRALNEEIGRFFKRPDATQRRAMPPPAPPGDPIGMDLR